MRKDQRDVLEPISEPIPNPEGKFEDPVPPSIVLDTTPSLCQLLAQFFPRLEGTPTTGVLISTSVYPMHVGPSNPIHGPSVTFQTTKSFLVPSIAPPRFSAFLVFTSAAMTLSKQKSLYR